MPEPQFTVSPAVLTGETADVYFHRTVSILRNEGINPVVVMDIFPQRKGILCGVKEVVTLLQKVLPRTVSQVWAVDEGAEVQAREIAVRIKAPYCNFGLYETAICGTLAHCTGWATAARECVEAAGDIPVVSFGARHVHPNVAAIMDYAAVVGGCTACSSVAGARLAGVTAAGTMPHAYILCVGDTVKAVQLFDRHVPPEVSRVALVDTFKDEVEETLRVASALKEKLRAVRLDTPAERGRVTPELVNEVRAHLDLNGFKHVEVFVSGGITPERIRRFLEAGCKIDGFGVGGYITSAPPNDFTADIREVEGKPIAKRGRLPGAAPNPRLKRVFGPSEEEEAAPSEANIGELNRSPRG
ncbi:MAG: nicotinate phosphoribosyltransferase [Chloroflexi bacterium]|nr:nicotinate phosphoribosyltransferase [Chloroflexota bacterium]